MREPSVYFIGAGPGAPDLITVRGRRILERADVIIYADSLVQPGIRDGAKPGAEIHGSASLPLERIVELMVEAARAGKLVARVQSGDPSIYGAIHEQMAALDREGIAYEIVPGVSSAFAAAATLGAELTVPGVAQSVIFTRVGGRTGLRGMERLAELARHGTTMVLFLSIAMIDRAVAELTEGGYPPDTPVAVVHRATWDDELVLRGTLGDIAGRVRAAKLVRQALIFVGRVVDPALHATAAGNRSHLYDGAYTHMFRKGTRRRGSAQQELPEAPAAASRKEASDARR